MEAFHGVPGGYDWNAGSVDVVIDMYALYALPGSDDIIRSEVHDRDQVAELVTMLRSGNEPPDTPAAIVLERTDSSALTIAPVREGVCLVWMASELLSFYSVNQQCGDAAGGGAMTSFSYFGHETEVPSRCAISEDMAFAAVEEFLRTGVPGIPFLLWEQD